MDKISHKGVLYNVIDTIRFSNTTHLIIQADASIEYINKEGNKFYIPPKDLSLNSNIDRPLSYIRKQYLLRYLVEFIYKRQIDEEKVIKKLTGSFKDYIKNSNVERFLYWPLLNDQEFSEELVPILSDLEYQLEQVINPIVKKKNDNVVETNLFIEDDALDIAFRR